MISETGDDAARMDRQYRLQRHVYDVSRRYFLLGRDHLIGDLDAKPGMTVLEIGCGTARNLASVAKRYPGTRLFGIDVSEAMLSTARGKLAMRDLGGRIHLARADAAAFDPQALFGISTFDRVFLSYTVSMITGWQDAIASAARITAGHGSLHVVDFGECRSWPAPLRRGLTTFLGRHQVTPRAALTSELTALSVAEGRPLDVRDIHHGYTSYAVLRAQQRVPE